MKIKTFILSILLALPMWVLADDTNTKIFPYEGDTKDTPLGYNGADALYINRDRFTGNSAVAGNIVRVYGWLTGEGAHKLYVGEWAADADIASKHLPGADYRIVSSLPCDIFLTEDMLNTITTGEKDFRIYGEGITLNVADLIQPGKAGSLHDPFKTLWTGWFWAGSWKTLEIFKETFTSIDWSQYQAIRFYHEAGRTDFTMNIFANDFDHKIADATSAIRLTSSCADLTLTESLRETLRGLTGSLFIQFDENGKSGFNVTDIVLIPYAVEGCDNCFYVTY